MTTREAPLWRSLEALAPPVPGVHRYLLVNQAGLPGQRALLSRLLTHPHQAMLGQDADACLDGVTPFVVCIDHAVMLEPDQFAALADAACYACALSVIDSPMNLRDLVRALDARTDVLLPDAMSMLLRHFDTRVFFALLDVLTEQQQNDFLSCATEWRSADREGALVPCAPLGADGIDRFASPLRLSSAQERALITASEPDAVMDMLATRAVPAYLALSYPARYPVVWGLVERARGWGLTELPDLQSFALLALLDRPDFDAHPPWSDLLPEVKAGRMTWYDAMQQVAQRAS